MTNQLMGQNARYAFDSKREADMFESREMPHAQNFFDQRLHLVFRNVFQLRSQGLI